MISKRWVDKLVLIIKYPVIKFVLITMHTMHTAIPPLQSIYQYTKELYERGREQ